MSSKYAGSSILKDKRNLIDAVKKLGLDGIKAGCVFVTQLATGIQNTNTDYTPQRNQCATERA